MSKKLFIAGARVNEYSATGERSRLCVLSGRVGLKLYLEVR